VARYGAPSTVWRKHSVADCSLRIGQWLVGVHQTEFVRSIYQGSSTGWMDCQKRRYPESLRSSAIVQIENGGKSENSACWGEPTAHQVDDELRHFAIITLRWLPPLDAAAGRERG
jgi:hypothetical protein